jgi:hypothetical protein
LENDTPFLKIGKLVSAETARDETCLAGIQLNELTFESRPLGKGSYGEVQLAKHVSGV